MTRLSTSTRRRSNGPSLQDVHPGDVLGTHRNFYDSGLRLQARGLERAMRITQGCIAFGAKRYERDMAFWAGLAKVTSPGDAAALMSEFMRTTQHDYLEEANRQMEDLAQAATDTVTDMQTGFEETEQAIEHASTQVRAVGL